MFKHLRYLSGTLIVSGVAVDFESLAEVHGTMFIVNSNITGLQNLKRIEGKLDVISSTMPTSLPYLRTIVGLRNEATALSLRNVKGLETLTPFKDGPNAKQHQLEIHGGVNIIGCKTLAHRLSHLTIHGELAVKDCGCYPSRRGTKVTGTVTLGENKYETLQQFFSEWDNFAYDLSTHPEDAPCLVLSAPLVWQCRLAELYLRNPENGTTALTE